MVVTYVLATLNLGCLTNDLESYFSRLSLYMEYMIYQPLVSPIERNA